MTSLEASLLALTISEAERQREDIRKTIELLETPGVAYTPEGREAFAEGISIAKQELDRVEDLLQRLRRGSNQADA